MPKLVVGEGCADERVDCFPAFDSVFGEVARRRRVGAVPWALEDSGRAEI